MASDECEKIIHEALEQLSEFSPQLLDKRLIIYGASGSLDFVFSVECTETGQLLTLFGLPAFFKKLPRGDGALKLLESLLEVAGQEYLMLSKIDENLLISQPPIPGEKPNIGDLQRFFSLGILLVLWMSKQLESIEKGGEVKPFSIEEMLRILESQQGTGEASETQGTQP
ncbi:MAG: hypothetical protein F7C35_08545 [Desulfurococcales archaeon]|nr:hypothetical protein [Desulfurococcales archaeon]